MKAGRPYLYVRDAPRLKYGKLSGLLAPYPQDRSQAPQGARIGLHGRAGVKNAELAKRLTEMGLPETDASVQLKINRGAFPAWFLMAALRAFGVTSLRLE